MERLDKGGRVVARCELAQARIGDGSNRRDEKIRRILEYSDRDLNKLSEMVAMAQSTVLRSIESAQNRGAEVLLADVLDRARAKVHAASGALA